MTKKDNKEFNFEKALENLEELVSSMENGELSLDDYIKWFGEAGMKAQILHLHGNVVLMSGSKVG